MSEWISVDDRLPISGPCDEKYEGGFYEKEVSVKLNDGSISDCMFWACWEYDGDEFIMEFDVGGVTHWREK